jgi:hypothetical protein
MLPVLPPSGAEGRAGDLACAVPLLLAATWVAL